MNKNIRICFMGTPTFGKNVLEKLIEEFSVVLVVTQPDKKGKRGNDLIISPVKELAIKNNIPVFQPTSIKEDFSMMKEFEFDFLVTAAYGQFIPLDVLHTPKFLTLNVHGSLLPKYRGGAPIQRAIENGDEYLGVSIMRTILKMDAGVIYKQSTVKLEENDNYGTMIEKLSIIGREDLVETINKFYSGEEVEAIHQNISEVCYAYNIEKNEELLDFTLSARSLFNKIRAFNPNPLTYFTHNGVNYKIYDSSVVNNDEDIPTGTILDNVKVLTIKCQQNALCILKIQAPGKNVMDIKDFLNGKRKEFKIGSTI